MFDVVAELPMFELILHLNATPIPMGSSDWWWMFAGMMARPRAISLRTNSGSIFSRPATKAISSVITPWRAKCICETLRDPFAAAVSVNLFSIQPSRIPILPPEEIPHTGYLSREANYRTAQAERQLLHRRDSG